VSTKDHFGFSFLVLVTSIAQISNVTFGRHGDSLDYLRRRSHLEFAALVVCQLIILDGLMNFLLNGRLDGILNLFFSTSFIIWFYLS
jgi:hypothetical protein